MRQYMEIAANLIDPPRKVLRREIKDDEIRILSESIRELGLLQPLGVVEEEHRYRVVYGHRRLLACQWCGLDPIPCMVGAGWGDEDDTSATAENVVRRDLTPVEEAQAIRGLIDGKGFSVTRVAKSVGRSEAWVRLRLEVLRWPVEFVEAIEREGVTVSVARELVGIDDEAVRLHYLKCAEESGCTAWQAKLWKREWEVSAVPVRDGEGPPPPPPSMMNPPRPVAPCHVCETTHEITALGFVRICQGCAQTLERTRLDFDNAPQ